MSHKEIENYETVKRWLNGIYTDHTGSSHTLDYYLRWLKRFADWLDKNPDQLIEARTQELKNEDMTIKRTAEENLRKFCIHLEQKEGFKRSTVRTYFSAIKSFYKYNYVPLQLGTPKKAVSCGVQPHTTEEIKALHDVADVRDRAIVLCLAESGMSREDFIELTYGDIKRDYEAEKDTIHLKVIRRKTQTAYETFLGKNAITALRNYLETRKQKGEKFTDKTPLWKSRKGGGFKTPDAVNFVLVRLGEKTGITSSPHRFRKFFESNLGTRVPSLLVRYWVGHSLGVEASYFLPSVEDQRKAYLEGYEKIDIFKREISEVERRKQQMRDTATMLGWDEDKKKWLENQMLKVKTTEELDKIDLSKIPPLRLGEKHRLVVARKKDEDCQKIVNEEELETWLAKGWHVVSVLRSGKVVVSND